MWVVRWTIVGLVMLVILGFALQNTTTVELKIWTWKSETIPLYLVAYFAFAAGILVAALVAAVNQVQQKILMRQAKREIRNLKEELTRLRRVNLEDALREDDDEDSDVDEIISAK